MANRKGKHGNARGGNNRRNDAGFELEPFEPFEIDDLKNRVIHAPSSQKVITTPQISSEPLPPPPGLEKCPIPHTWLAGETEEHTDADRDETASDSSKFAEVRVPITSFEGESERMNSIVPPSAADMGPRKLRVCPQDFDLLNVLGRGGYGTVFQVRKNTAPKQGNIYAMKVLKKATLVARKDREHTRNERDILQMVKHPFLVELVFAFQTTGRLYLILEYLAGGELFAHVKRCGQELSEDQAAFYLAEIVLALGHLHSLGIVYRDLKPENVLLDRSGHVKLTDFGLSKVALNDSGRTFTQCGTVEYMAPEVIHSNGEGHGKEVDWWSLGILTYDLLHGFSPFADRSNNRNKIKEKILTAKVKFYKNRYLTEDAQKLIRELLKKNPSERLGAGEKDYRAVEKHLFFRHIDWVLVESRTLPPPFVPKLTSMEDVTYFDKSFTGEDPRASPITSESTLHGNHSSGTVNNTEPFSPNDTEHQFFRGFSYVAPSVMENVSSTSWIADAESFSLSRLPPPLEEASSPSHSASSPLNTSDDELCDARRSPPKTAPHLSNGISSKLEELSLNGAGDATLNGCSAGHADLETEEDGMETAVPEKLPVTQNKQPQPEAQLSGPRSQTIEIRGGGAGPSRGRTRGGGEAGAAAGRAAGRQVARGKDEGGFTIEFEMPILDGADSHTRTVPAPAPGKGARNNKRR